MTTHMPITDWERVAARDVTTNGITLRVFEHGEGRPDRPPVVLCHGFPELAFSWRHQVFPLAEAGYRVLVPDMRGYGGSSRPDDADAYDILTLCADLAGLLDDVGADDAFFVGHDWGASVVWNMALLHPERVRAVAGMSVPPTPRAPAPPLPILRSRNGDDFYIVWFQEPGVADRALSQNVRRTLVTREIYSAKWAAKADEQLPPPRWMGDEELTYYVKTFEETGFTGGLNYYRNLDRNWALTEHLDGRLINQPSLFITGSKDPVGKFMPAHLDRMLTDLRGHVVLDGAGHWIQQERAEDVNAALLEFLSTLG
ncbi:MULTISPECIES: alpha/beta fold hydrolase [unclassified Streptomyces]|uniref:alpha/beta fold hydrolase n=1 Tax=unclassified Streptomyces TaxID=2593676 RepID=UPI002DD7FC54|nr:alpha/beta hydrolase [Streptomyces sp. NBC_01445]WSE02442.1 alpha/beta hydrolase [Streptomyces sp. NBC_01445]